jgi:arylsulfatase A-like enzyme
MATRNAIFRRREFCASLGGAALAGCSTNAAARPNIVWIIGEDFSPDLGCYGNTLVYTPNLDRLAAQGVRFDRAFVTAPVCSASRSAIAIGMYQTSAGVHHHRSHRTDGYQLPTGVEVFTSYLRRAGYFTANLTTPAPGIRGTGKTDFNFNVKEPPFDGTDWNQRKPGQPFYAQVNFSETHRAFHPDPERPVDRRKIVVPPYYPDHPAIREDFALYYETAQHLDRKSGAVLDRLKKEGLADDTIVFFFGDHGRPMPRGKQFLYDEGIHIPLILWMPEKYKTEGYSSGAVRSDFVSAIDITATTLQLAGIEPPKHMHGQVIVGPGAKPRDHIFAARDRCDETTDRIRCVRTAGYKYIRNYFPERPYTQQNNYKDTAYPPLAVMRQLREQGELSGPPAQFLSARRPAEELYDLANDPHEVANLIDSPSHREPLVKLRSRLDEWIARTGDLGEKPEVDMPQQEYRYRTQLDGWATREFSRASKTNGALRIECSGKTNSFLRTYVAEGGDLRLRFRARSNGIQPRQFFWATIAHMGYGPEPGRSVPLNFTPGARWSEYSIPFIVEGWLSVLGFDLGPGDGVVEFDWIALERAAKPVDRWEFA